MRLRYNFWITGYVVMPEHVQLLISEPAGVLLNQASQALKLSVTVKWLQRPFWQARYYDFNVYTEKKRIEKLRYMHRNPVKRRLVSKSWDWPWSSFRHYLTGYIGTVEIESEWTATRRERAASESHVSKASVKFREMVYIMFGEILYTLLRNFCFHRRVDFADQGGAVIDQITVLDGLNHDALAGQGLSDPPALRADVDGALAIDLQGPCSLWIVPGRGEGL